MTTLEPTHGPYPYQTAAKVYWDAGWRGVLPLPPRKKSPPPDGWTGNRADDPAWPDVQSWMDDGFTVAGGRRSPAGNIALRLPEDVIGIDVDHYGDKPGGLVLADLERNLGPLPPTWRDTSRTDGISGIRFYRVPVGLRWPGIMGPGIETIRHGHRYAVVWPSIHPTGGMYRWIDPDGVTAVHAPSPTQFPALPDAWTAHFTRGEEAVEQDRADVTTADVRAFLAARSAGDPCPHMVAAMTEATDNIERAARDGSARHDAALAATNRIAWLIGEGHPGGNHALVTVANAFRVAVAGARTPDEAEGEWWRMVGGAVSMSLAAHPDPVPPGHDPCTTAGGLLPPKEQPWQTPPESTGTSLPAPPTSDETPGSSTPSNASPQPWSDWPPSAPSPSPSPTSPANGVSATSAAAPVSAASPASVPPPASSVAVSAGSSLPAYPETMTPSWTTTTTTAEHRDPTPSAGPVAGPGTAGWEPSAGNAEDAAPSNRSSWWPRNLTPALTGERIDPPPVHLARLDGACAFYAGRVNGIIGPSESGKTWVALVAVAQALVRGEHVTYLDFEDTMSGIVGRLRAMGVPTEYIDRFFAYIDPEEVFNQYAQSGIDLAEHFAIWNPSLVVVDGYNAAISIQGGDLNSNKDVTLFTRTVFKFLVRNNRCVVYIDHVAKSKENTSAGGIGAQAKRADTTGTTLRVDTILAFGKGQKGKLRLFVDKDRQGDVRGTSSPGASGHWYADVEIKSTVDGSIDIQITVPEGYDAETRERRPFRPTYLMQRVSEYLVDNAGESKTDVVKGIGKNRNATLEAIDLLIEEDYVKVSPGPRGAKLLENIRPYTAPNELLGDGGDDGDRFHEGTESSRTTRTEPVSTRTTGTGESTRTTGTHPTPNGVVPVRVDTDTSGPGPGLGLTVTATGPNGEPGRRVIGTGEFIPDGA